MVYSGCFIQLPRVCINPVQVAKLKAPQIAVFHSTLNAEFHPTLGEYSAAESYSINQPNDMIATSALLT
jgi:hypothetical protein